MIGLVGLGYGLGRGQHTKKDRSAQCRQHHSNNAIVPFIGRCLHADVFCASLEHSWQHLGDVSEWFMQKIEPLLNFGAYSGQLRHSLCGGVMLQVQQKGRLCSC